MIGKNIKYYRLKNRMTKAELAKRAGLSAMAITHYEKDERNPDFDVMNKLAEALKIPVALFIEHRCDEGDFTYNEFRTNKRMNKRDKEFILENIKKHFENYNLVAELAGGKVLPDPLVMNELIPHKDAETNAKLLRMFLRISELGCIRNITKTFEEKGILVYFVNSNTDSFCGVNGTFNNRPYIAVNSKMSNQEKRMTLIHEFVHMAFNWNCIEDNENPEKTVEDIAVAFLLPREDLYREIGLKRTNLSSDMLEVCKEYNIPIREFIKRLYDCKIISHTLMRKCLTEIANLSEKTICNETEQPKMFRQLVLRLLNEEEITSSRAAELLDVSMYELLNLSYVAV